eukprot:COSAG02_NODE_226_length_28168_cov_64.619153_2_plen_143_part_00
MPSVPACLRACVPRKTGVRPYVLVPGRARFKRRPIFCKLDDYGAVLLSVAGIGKHLGHAVAALFELHRCDLPQAFPHALRLILQLLTCRHSLEAGAAAGVAGATLPVPVPVRVLCSEFQQPPSFDSSLVESELRIQCNFNTN